MHFVVSTFFFLIPFVMVYCSAIDYLQWSYDENYQRQPDINQVIQACGRKLNDILRLVCVGPLAKRSTQQRKDAYESYDWLHNEVGDKPSEVQHSDRPFLSRKKRQIVRECCYESCTLRHIRDNYCS